MNVMKKAWEIAKEGQRKFGGKVKQYFAQALKMAWSIVKSGMELVGTEKQVKWANDIRKAVIDFVNEVEGMEKLFRNESRKQRATENFANFKEMVMNNDSSVFFIDNFQSLSKANPSQYGDNIEWANYMAKSEQLQIMSKSKIAVETGANNYFEAAFLMLRNQYQNR